LISRRSVVELPSICIWVPLGVLLASMACSSSEDPETPLANESVDGGDGGRSTPDGSARSESEDAGDAGDAGALAPPPPYDFAVKCAGDASAPCVTQIAARGGMHACAVLKDGSARCWGSNGSGQLGTGSNDAGPLAGYQATPQRVLRVSNAKGVAATGQGSSGTTCVVADSGQVSCFGSDASGQLGRPSGSSSGPNPDPVVVVGIQAKSVTLTNTFALAVDSDDHVWSWGANDTRQLARDTSAPDAGPPKQASRADFISPRVRSCAGTTKTGFVVAEDGSLLSWGGGTTDQLGRVTSLVSDPVPTALALVDASSVTAGISHACALGRGEVRCWGKDDVGQLGTGRKVDESFPARVALPPSVYPVAVTAGANNSCIISADGEVYCWGANGSGQLATSSGIPEATPVRIVGLAEDAVGVAIMDKSICALLRGGSVACWGDNLLGQLGRGARDAEIHAKPGPVVFE
jgi:alpha-tubulin suppressor-like RCC1 family protein